VSASTEQLLRLLRIIPLASRPEGLRIGEAARLCQVAEAVIDADIRVLADRSWYLPPGSTDDFQILLEGDRVHLVAPPAFRRPVRLGLHELLAVSLALRCAGLTAEKARALGRALEEACALEGEVSGAADSGAATRAPAAGGAVASGNDPSRAAHTELSAAPTAEPLAILLRRGDADELHDQVARALVTRHQLEVSYLKEGAAAPETRRLEPWHLVHAEGESYLLAHDLDRGAPRLFRVDRMLAVRITETPATAPMALEAADVSAEGAVRLVADGRPLETTRVRYSPQVARWVRERNPEGRELEDGSYEVDHPILTDAWIVRRVLRYGPDAEILSPPRLRRAMARALRT
jgi:proteasome accessory factor B